MSLREESDPIQPVHVRLSVLEIQAKRMQSDIESEKATRNRLYDDIARSLRKLDDRLRGVEKHVWMGVGVFVAVQVLLHFVAAWIQR